MRYIIGVDGGGTKTEVVVCTAGGNIVKREKRRKTYATISSKT